jgi:2-C-methyl-D-erythritol 4-phosphate cytidylyltransferase
MGIDLPKQYLPFRDSCVLDYSARLFSHHEKITAVVVVIAQNDPYWSETRISTSERARTAPGGVERCHSVLNGLKALESEAAPEDWVLVHDAARPCLSIDDLNKLINTLYDHKVGGLLAIPVRDTMKRSDTGNNVVETINRDNLWHALTPQMFTYGDLTSAISQALGENIIVTDESQAIELTGKQPMLIEGHTDNIKITHKQDLATAELLLAQQEN